MANFYVLAEDVENYRLFIKCTISPAAARTSCVPVMISADKSRQIKKQPISERVGCSHRPFGGPSFQASGQVALRHTITRALPFRQSINEIQSTSSIVNQNFFSDYQSCFHCR